MGSKDEKPTSIPVEDLRLVIWMLPVNLLLFVALEPRSWAGTLFGGTMVMLCAAMAKPRPDPSPVPWKHITRAMRMATVAFIVCQYVLKNLTNPAVICLIATSTCYFIMRIAELHMELPGSPCYVPEAGPLRALFVYWLADVRTLRVVPAPDRKSFWALLWPYMLYTTISQGASFCFVQPTLPLVVQVYGLMLACAAAMMGLWNFYHVLLFIIWRGRLETAQFMGTPWAADSIRDFWGRHWNLTMHESLKRCVFHPLVPKVGKARAAFATFAVSGVLHAWPMSVAGVDDLSVLMVLSFFAAHAGLTWLEQQALIPSNRWITLALLLLTWPLFGVPLLTVLGLPPRAIATTA